MVRTLVAAGAGVALLAACSSGGGGSSSSTTVSASTAFSTIPIATTTTAPAASGQGGGGPTDSTGGGGGAAAGGATYTVVSGDYLLGIAKKLGVPLQSLLDANGMNANSLITPGQKLKIPAATTGSTTATTAAGGSGGTGGSGGSGGSTASSTASSAAATTTTTVADAPGTYTVRPNDGWSIIAARLGVNAADLAAFNDLTLNSVLIPGQKLRIPPARGTTTTAKA
jgi:LysM repeat protein